MITSKELLASIKPSTTDNIVNIFYNISKVSSKKDKLKILNDNLSQTIKDILYDTYNDNLNFHIKSYNISSAGDYTIEQHYKEFHDLLIELSQNNISGNAARDAVDKCISKFEVPAQMILARILNRNLKIGLSNSAAESITTLTKFPVRLAKEYNPKINIFDGNWMISRKLDGVRCLAFISSHDGCVDVEFKSRQNKTFTTLSNLIPEYVEIFKNIPGDYVIDGEICSVDKNGLESFSGLMSLITRKNYTMPSPKHIIYDFLTLDEFWGKQQSPTFFDRIHKLNSLHINSPHIYVLPQYVLHDKNQLSNLQKQVEQFNWEGLMVAKNVSYEGKRTKNLLKIKSFKDNEYIVTGVIIGDQARNTDDGTIIVTTVAAITIKHKGNVVKVGTGFSQMQRDEWFKDPNKIIGKTVTIRYFEETTDKKTGLKSLRFPTLYYIYENGRQL